MKSVIPGERFEERGHPMCWFWFLMGVLWLIQAVLSITEGELGFLFACRLFTCLASLCCAALHTRYLLIVEESGVTWRYGLTSTRRLGWDEIVRVVDVEKGAFTRSAGLYIHAAGSPDKPLFIGPRSELLPIVNRYLPIPVESGK